MFTLRISFKSAEDQIMIPSSSSNDQQDQLKALFNFSHYPGNNVRNREMISENEQQQWEHTGLVFNHYLILSDSSSNSLPSLCVFFTFSSCRIFSKGKTNNMHVYIPKEIYDPLHKMYTCSSVSRCHLSKGFPQLMRLEFCTGHIHVQWLF